MIVVMMVKPVHDYSTLPICDAVSRIVSLTISGCRRLPDAKQAAGGRTRDLKYVCTALS